MWALWLETSRYCCCLHRTYILEKTDSKPLKDGMCFAEDLWEALLALM